MKTFKFILLFVSFLFLFLSCDKNTGVDEPLVSTQNEMTLANPSNSNNPFDCCGLLHNKALRISLDKLAEYPSEVSFDERISVACQAVQQVLLEEGIIQTRSTVNFEDDEELIALVQFLMEDMENNYENFIEALGLDAYTKEQLHYLFRTVIAMAEYEDITADDVFDEVVAFETKVLNNTIPIPINDREYVLSGTSTLRYSLSFWADEMDMSAATRGKKWWQWLIIGAADALGYFAPGGGIMAAVGASTLANTLIKDETQQANQ